MAAYNKFFPFVANLGNGDFVLNTNVLKLALFTDVAAPSHNDGLFDTATTHQLNVSGCTEVANGNGYTAGGLTLPTTTYGQTAGTATLDYDHSQLLWTASGAGFAFRYFVLYDVTTGSAGARFLIGYWDWGSLLTLAAGQSVGATLPSGVFTLA